VSIYLTSSSYTRGNSGVEAFGTIIFAGIIGLGLAPPGAWGLNP